MFEMLSDDGEALSIYQGCDASTEYDGTPAIIGFEPHAIWRVGFDSGIWPAEYLRPLTPAARDMLAIAKAVKP